jgi:hypothetical protein
MQARTFWKTVTVDRSDLLERFLALMDAQHVAWCVVGGQGVNAYVDPVVSLDLDLVVAAADLAALEPLLQSRFDVARFPHSLNISARNSDLRLQIQTDPRYAEFIARAQPRSVLGRTMPVAQVEDVLVGKVWAAQDPQRRSSKRQKDLADIARLVEAFPHLRTAVPTEILERLI